MNKILDYLVANGLEHLAMLTLTIWMTRGPAAGPSAGARSIDFEMKEELVKPWIAVTAFVKRLTRYGWKSPGGVGKRGFSRFIITLISSICFLLLGAAINTIGLPKGRWYPDLWPASKHTEDLLRLEQPRQQIEAIDWTNYWNLGWGTVGSGPQSWTAAIALASASTYTVLSRFGEFYFGNPGWSGIGEYHDSLATGINRNVSEQPFQSVSLQGNYIVDLYNSQKKKGSAGAKYREGMVGTANLTLPLLMTNCSLESNKDLGTGQINVSASVDDMLSINISPTNGTNHSRISCSVMFRQVLFPISFWLNGPVSDGLHLWYNGFDNVHPDDVKILGPTIADPTILQQLGTQFSSMLPYLDGLLPQSTFADHLSLTAAQEKTLNPVFKTEIESMAAVLGVIMQHLITISHWNMSSSDSEVTVHYPIRWWVYGSGPRLSWEWIAVVPLVIFIAILTYDVYLTLRHRIKPGPWLTIEGMMFSANTSGRLKGAEKTCIGVLNDGYTAKYFVRDKGNGMLELVDNAANGRPPSKSRLYGQQGERIKKLFG